MRWLWLCDPTVLNPKPSWIIKQIFRVHKIVTTSLTEKLNLSFPNFRNGFLLSFWTIIKAEMNKK